MTYTRELVRPEANYRRRPSPFNVMSYIVIVNRNVKRTDAVRILLECSLFSQFIKYVGLARWMQFQKPQGDHFKYCSH